MVDLNVPANRDIAAYKCLDKLSYHTRFFYKRMYGRRYILERHTEIISEALERVLAGKCRRLIICVPPRYGKTELGVINFISHGLALNPQAKFIHLSGTEPLALENSEKAKSVVQSEAYAAVFPNVKVKRGSDSKKKWYTEAGGGVYATSASGQVTGFGAGIADDPDKVRLDEDNELMDEIGSMGVDANGKLVHNIEGKRNFGGAIIIDDPIKPDDAESDIKRNRINSRWTSTIKSRVNSRNTPVVVIMQRIHPDDMVGFLLRTEPGEWEVITLPAIIEEDGQQKALCPRIHTLAELMKMRAADAYIFDRQYMQNPKSREGLLFPEEELLFYNPDTVNVEKLAEYRFFYGDPADEGGDNLAGPSAYLIGNKIYIPHVICNTKGTEFNEPYCTQRILTDKSDAVEIEGNSAWKLFAKAIRAVIFKKLRHCDFRIVVNTKNKQTRIMAQAGFIKTHFVFNKNYMDDPEYEGFMSILTGYLIKASGNQKDDPPDSLAGVAVHFRNNFSHLWEDFG